MWIASIIIIIIVLGLVATYNSLIKLTNLAKEGWSGIEVQLNLRYNLIPNLVKTVEGYSQHEQIVLKNVVEARERAVRSIDQNERSKAENTLTTTLKSLFAVAEDYPGLKANENFLELQKELSRIEDDIQSSRRYYNGVVRDLNIRVESFPINIIASLFGFRKWNFFQLEGIEAKTPPKL